MRYGDARCNTIVDGADLLICAFTPEGEPWNGRCFMLRDCIRYRRGPSYSKPRVKLSWVRMKYAANVRRFSP